MRWGHKKIRFLLIVIGLGIIVAGSAGSTIPDETKNTKNQPIVIITIDKTDSLELWNSELPSIKKLITTSACGLMNIRSAAGYGNSGSGFLTLGSGSRATMPGMLGDTFEREEALPGGSAGSYLSWTFGSPVNHESSPNLIIPEMGWIINQAATEDHPVEPGRLGTVFRSNGWRTCLLGNRDTPMLPYRPGGLFLMDRRGVIDEGNAGGSINARDEGFPYLIRFSVSKTIRELQTRLAEKKLILIEFGDFSRLDSYQNEMLPDQFKEKKGLTWNRFDQFLGKVLELRKSSNFSLIILSPSISREGTTRKNLLAPIIINSPQYQPGLLTSGTTRWSGLVANIDILPTLVKIAGIPSGAGNPGRVITVKPIVNHLKILQDLNHRLIGANTSQRPILDWYMGIIAACWIAGLFFLYIKRETVSKLLLTGLLVVPLTLIGLPLLPIWSWSLFGFWGSILILTSVFTFIKPLEKRILLLSGLIWSVLILDQILGWRLIRFSALGYSAMAGSRYYGIGNEFMGVFLATAFVLSHLIYQKTGFKWPSLLISGITISVLSLPNLGAKFGGILAGSAGFSFYLIKLYQIDFKHRKLWLSLSGFILMLAVIGWWDSMRPPEIQTHIGRFIRLFFTRDFGQVGQIILRKLSMNLKLTVFSPWIRIILLAFILGIIHRTVTKVRLAGKEDGLVWKSILVTGFAAYLVNDAGVLAFATCLAYGFSFILLRLTKSLHDTDKVHTLRAI